MSHAPNCNDPHPQLTCYLSKKMTDSNPSKKPRTEDSVPPPVFSSTEELSQGSTVNKTRYDNLVSGFEAKYGRKPGFVARAPGRVNIIGEHIDYCGYGVLPMAIEQDVTIACSTNDRNELRFANVNTTQYTDHTCPVEGFTIDGHTWYNYLLCGFKGVVETLNLTQPIGMDILIDGNVPPSAGLSSSSALVCCAALTTAYANKVDMLSKKEFAELCAKCERYIGTEGGGMDQAISFLGAENKALMIEFNPIRPTEVQLPEGVRFIIANSLVLEDKAAASQFNVRVAECRLSAQVIAKKKGKDWRQVRKLLTLQESLGLPLSEMTTIVDETLHSEEYNREELCKILEITEEELQSECLNEKTKSVESFKLHDRAKHVFGEAYRVHVFKDTANSTAEGSVNSPEILGKLMDDSHKSCSELYECSCKQLDELVAVCKSAGALGSRLTGAGWGGCAVSIVAEDKVEDFLKEVQKNFYEKLPDGTVNLKRSLFSSKPGPGAAVCNLS